jgi:hypothetical protein
MTTRLEILSASPCTVLVALRVHYLFVIIFFAVSVCISLQQLDSSTSTKCFQVKRPQFPILSTLNSGSNQAKQQSSDSMCRPDALTVFMNANNFSSKNLMVLDDNALSLQNKPKMNIRVSRRSRIEGQRRGRGYRAPIPGLCRWGSLPNESAYDPEEHEALRRTATDPRSAGSTSPPRRPRRIASFGVPEDNISPPQLSRTGPQLSRPGSVSCPQRPQRKASLSDSSNSRTDEQSQVLY